VAQESQDKMTAATTARDQAATNKSTA